MQWQKQSFYYFHGQIALSKKIFALSETGKEQVRNLVKKYLLPLKTFFGNNYFGSFILLMKLYILVLNPGSDLISTSFFLSTKGIIY